MRVWTPTDNHRLNELVGFLLVTLALLLSLSLVSYNPQDTSLNVAAPAAAGDRPVYNWIGPFGAYISDALFQAFGFSAGLLPLCIALLGVRWFRSQPLDAAACKVAGWVLLLVSSTGLLSMLNVYPVRGVLPAGGLMGELVRAGLNGAFGAVGALLVVTAGLFTGLFFTTTFSFTAAGRWLHGPIARLNFFPLLHARWRAWHDAREQKQMARRVEKLKTAGRPAAPPQTVASLDPMARAKAAEAEDDDLEMDDAAPSSGPVVIRLKDPSESGPAPKRASEPKIATGKASYRLPSAGLLRMAERGEKVDESELKECAQAIEEKCHEFEVNGTVTQINPGPVVTTYEFKPEAGIKYSRITGLQDDLCLALRAESILIERIPGKSTVGIEVPNQHRQTIALREMFEAAEFVNSPSKLTLALGKDLIGRIRVTDLAQMPHLLIAGSTGTGKSVFINSLIVSMLYKATPEELKLVLVDPKRLELGLYENIPHLFTPVVTDPRLAANVLRNATREMERRLKLLAQRGVRNIDQYNRTFQKEQSLSLFQDAADPEHKPLPYVVIVIDELADLMMVDTNGVEESITRLAQMARAVGIHLILATQRPSVDVITGLIKANFPARISFRVASKVDSRTILDANGSESLLGRGDMLYLPAGSARLHRIHGPLISEGEIVAVCDFWRAQDKAKYNEELLRTPAEDSAEGSGGEGGEADYDDDLYQDAVRVVCEMGRASTSTLQRRLRIGYGRAARLIDLMEKDGIVGPPDGTKPREVLKKKDWMREFDQSMK